jgi:hypothetical protein
LLAAFGSFNLSTKKKKKKKKKKLSYFSLLVSL